MSNWELGELARATESDVFGGKLPEGIAAVGTDSRSLPPASLFVALRGERFDGHQFIDDAINAGARAVVVDREGHQLLGNLAVPQLVVDDTTRALGDIANYVRRQHEEPVVAITGSNGKTTTKELTASALAFRGSVHKTQGNYNNLIGLPLTLFAWDEKPWCAVVEMGMNAPGEIERLTEIADPQVGLVTNVAPAHLEGLGTLEDVARAKGELYETMSSDSTAVINSDDPMIEKICVPLAGERAIVRFGSSTGDDVRISECSTNVDGLRVDLDVRGTSHSIELPLIGEHNAWNAAAALATALALDVDVAAAAQSMTTVSLPDGRMRVSHNTTLDVRLLDDTYNANPASMDAAFRALAALGEGRRVAILGDMLELGERAAEFHAATGTAAARHGVTWLLALGEHSEAVARGASDAGADAEAFTDIAMLLSALDEGLKEGDRIVVKGSRGMCMERVVRHLEGKQ